MAQYQWDGNDLVLNILLQPRASSDEIVGPHGDQIRVRITAPPVDGKANSHLIKFLAKQFAVTKSSVMLEKGQSGRSKLVRIRRPAKLPPFISCNQ